jgi:antirestriction protein ArdC
MNNVQRENKRIEKQREYNRAYDSIVQNPSWSNYLPVIMEFTARGIPEQDILPKENVLTFNAWKALGRYVRKGEKGVKIAVWKEIPGKKSEPQFDENEKLIPSKEKDEHGLYCTMATVFHISQTELYNQA